VPAGVELHDRAGRVDPGGHTTTGMKQARGTACGDVQGEDTVAGSDHGYPVLEID